MPRKPQFGSIYKRGEVYWIKYYADGRAFYESSKSDRYGDAQKLLEKRRSEVYTGTHLDHRTKRTGVSQLLEALIRDYKVNGKSVDWVDAVVRKHLEPFFGKMTASNLKYDALQSYIAARLGTGAANATINRELALLHRAFTLAKDAGVLNALPRFPKKLAENNVRKGFFERERFLSVRKELPSEIQPIATYAYWTGCRKGEILRLRWAQVDLDNRVVRLEPGETKNDEGRTVPLAKELFECLQAQKELRDRECPECPWVFFRNGDRVRSFRGAWVKACNKAGLVNAEGSPENLFHDLRRTGVRNLIRAGVPERVAMMISGHKTRAVFDRYNIVSEQDLHEAARRLDSYIEGRENDRPGDNLVTIAKSPKKLKRRRPL